MSGSRFRFENFDKGEGPNGVRVAEVVFYVEKAKLNAARLEVRKRMNAGDEDYVIKMPQPTPRFTGGRNRR